ncbi:hypothetical protein ACFVSN_17295 [Kitasatospora sp. NPDC057904]|uniref:hypothetical protein n=1 Tax=Kitasatospora sp. NPDC057904 TaxID=3346275 RepID=UPI0036DEB87B
MRTAIILISSAQITLAVVAASTKRRVDAYPNWYPLSLMVTCVGLLAALAAEEWI